MISAPVFTISATFFGITASFPEQVFPEIGPFAVGNRQHRAAFHPHVVPSALGGDDFRHMMEVDDGVVVDSEEVRFGQRFLEMAERFCAGEGRHVGEMQFAYGTVAHNVVDVGRPYLLGRLPRFQG